MKITKWCLLLLTLIAWSGTQAQDFLKVDMAFAKARKLTLQHGWRPVRMHAKQSPADEPNFPITGTERLLVKNGLIEVDSCSMDAGSLCNFIYQRSGTCMRVMTRGERLKDMKVVAWDQAAACPPD